MSGVEVTPAQLRAAAGSCTRGGQTAEGVRRTVLSAGCVDTGRPDTAAAVSTVVAELTAAVAGLAAALHGDAQALQGAAAAYTTVDSSAVCR